MRFNKLLLGMHFFCLVFLWGGVSMCIAAERPLVTIKRSSGEEVKISRAQFNALPVHSVNSSEQGRSGKFKGPLLRDLLNMVGVTSQKIEISAYDNYFVQVERTYWVDYESILATEKDGVTMKIRDKGPLWLIFPWDRFPELRNERFYNLSIWQIKEIKELP